MRFLLINTVDALAISLFLYLLVTFRDRRRRKGLPYPPGPPSWPIIGCLFDIPKDKPWIVYTDMSKKYGRRNILGTTASPQLNRASLGDIICLRALSKVTVVLSSFSAIKDLLEKRGDYYSDRPSVPIVEMYVAKHFQFTMSFQVDNPRSLGWITNGQYSWSDSMRLGARSERY
jgi:hypothetical protein